MGDIERDGLMSLARRCAAVAGITEEQARQVIVEFLENWEPSLAAVWHTLPLESHFDIIVTAAREDAEEIIDA